MQTRLRGYTNGKGNEGLAAYLLGGRLKEEAPAGLIPYIPPELVDKFFDGQIRQALRSILGHDTSPEVAEFMANQPRVIDKARTDIKGALTAEYQREIDGKLSLEFIFKAYLKIQKQVVAKAIDDDEARRDRGERPLFTEKVKSALLKGEIIATEDFIKLLCEDLDNFYAEVAGLTDRELNNDLIKDHVFSDSIKSFHERFDEANLALLDELGLREPGESDTAFVKRITDRLAEAVRFLNGIHDAVHKYQLQSLREVQGAFGSEEKPQVYVLPAPDDLAQKRFYDLAETLFYPGSQYATGKERKFVAQQIILLVLLYNKVHQWPVFMKAGEVCRRMNNTLNQRFDFAVGRQGTEVENVFVTADDARSVVNVPDSVRLRGLKAFKLKPLRVWNSERQTEEILFPEGIKAIINGRVKSADSIVLKCLNKGNLDRVHDIVAFEFVLDHRNLSAEDFKTRVRELKRYIVAMWHADRLIEDDPQITGDNRFGHSETNPHSAEGFKVEKIVFHKTIEFDDGSKIMVPVEVQIKSLETKLLGDSAVGDVSHKSYEGKRALRPVAWLFPREVFGSVAEDAGDVATETEGE